MLKSTFQFNFSDLKLNITQIEKVMGYKEGESHETISELVQKVLKEAETDFRIRAEYDCFPGRKIR